jgi:hypothetical protein
VASSTRGFDPQPLTSLDLQVDFTRERLGDLAGYQPVRSGLARLTACQPIRSEPAPVREDRHL